jgi:hypothetical protein
MKASVQYNDIKGTAAADISDFCHNSLQSYLCENFVSYNGDRYSCIGCTLFVGGQSEEAKVNIHFVCYDNQEKKYVMFVPYREMDTNEVFAIFKRLEIVIGNNNIDEVNVADEDWIDLK